MRRVRRPRGYTLIEAMVVVAIAAILVGIGGWQATALLPRWRTDAAARKLGLDLRAGLAIAARTNAPIELQVALAPAGGCDGASWQLVSAAGLSYDRVCLPDDYRGVVVSRSGANTLGNIGCGTGLAAPSSGCSFCDADGTGTLLLLPTGEILLPGSNETAAALLLAPAQDAAKNDPSHLRALTVAAGTSRTRTLRVNGGAWECP